MKVITLILSVPEEGYSRNTSCGVNLISTLLFLYTYPTLKVFAFFIMLAHCIDKCIRIHSSTRGQIIFLNIFSTSLLLCD